MNVNFHKKLIIFRRLLFVFLISTVFIYFISVYISHNYELPKWLTIQIKTEKKIYIDVYYDIGKGYGEKYKIGKWIRGSSDFQTVRFLLPLKHIRSFRIDPLIEPGTVFIKSLKISSIFGDRYVWLSNDIVRDFTPRGDTKRFELIKDSLEIESEGNDPYFIYSAPTDFLFKINKVLLFFILILIFVVLFLSVKFFNKHIEKLLSINHLLWLCIILLIAFLLRCYHITYPINDFHTFRQTQTAGLIRDFYNDGINLLYPRMITLGDPGIVILEFPLFQAISAFLYKIFIPDIIFTRFVSIACGLLSTVFVYRISMKFLDKKSAVFASLFFAFAPLNIFYNRVPMPDSLTILFSLIMLDCLIEGIINRKNISLISGIIAGCFGLMMKSPYIAPLYLPLIYLTYKKEKKLKSFLNFRFLIAIFLPVTMMVLWQRHANSVNEIYFAASDYPFKDLYSAVVVKLHPFNRWYFGTIEQRLDYNNYLIILERIYQEIVSKIGIGFLIIGFITIYKKKEGSFFYIWLFSIFLSIMIAFNLNIMHNFYQLPLVPILSIFCGSGFYYFIDLFKKRKAAILFIGIIFICYLFISRSIAVNRFFIEENNLLEVGQFIDENTERYAMIATSLPKHDNWDPTLMFYANRRGFNVPHGILNKEMIEYLKKRNIRYLVLVDYNDLNIPFLSPYKIVAENERAKIYDISSRGKQVGRGKC